MTRLRDLLRDRSGNVAMIFGLSAIPITILAGFAIDLSQVYAVRARLTGALDAAALAVGSTIDTNANLQTRFQQFFDANYPPEKPGTPFDVTVTPSDTLITAQASARVDTPFLSLIGYDEITVTVRNEVVRETTGIEVVMALDNTGSMSGSKLSELKSSAREMVEILFGDDSTSDTVKIGLVPFAGKVNIGSGNASSVSDPGAYNWGSNHGWWGCVRARAYPHDTRDSSTSDGGLWTPFYWEDTRRYDRSGNANDWIRNGRHSIDRSPPSNRGPNKYCPREVTPLTNQKFEILSEIDAMWAVGYTHINIGAVWAWRLISPSAPFTEGTTYHNEDWEKAVIVMTDGANTTSNSVDTAYGYRWEGGLGTTSSYAARQTLDERLLEVCTNMKAEGIIVYTIAFDIYDSYTVDMMTDCASSRDKFFVAGQSNLSEVFRSIGRQLSDLRLSR